MLSLPTTDFQETKLCQTLQSFDREEWTNFRLWLKSPFATTKTAPLRCYEALRNLHPYFVISKEQLYRKIFKKRSFDNRTLNNVLSLMDRLAKDFLACRAVLNDPYERMEQLRRRAYETGDLAQHAEWIEAQLKIGQRQTPTTHKHHLRRFAHHFDAYFRAPEKETLDQRNEHLSTALTELTTGFELARLTIEHERNRRNKILRTDEAVQASETHPAESLYRHRLATEKASAENCRAFAALLWESYPDLHPEYRRIFCFGLLNDYIRLIGEGAYEVAPAALNLVRRMDADKVFLQNEYITGISYLNATGIALLNGAIDYAEDFAGRYANSIDHEAREGVTHLVRARIAFFKKDYDQALHWSENYTGAPTVFELPRRMVTVKVHFERALAGSVDDEVWRYAVEAFRKYTYRDTFYSESRLLSYREFCRILLQFSNALLPVVQPEKLQQLRPLVKNAPAYGRQWFQDLYERYC